MCVCVCVRVELVNSPTDLSVLKKRGGRAVRLFAAHVQIEVFSVEGDWLVINCGFPIHSGRLEMRDRL